VVIGLLAHDFIDQSGNQAAKTGAAVGPAGRDDHLLRVSVQGLQEVREVHW